MITQNQTKETHTSLCLQIYIIVSVSNCKAPLWLAFWWEKHTRNLKQFLQLQFEAESNFLKCDEIQPYAELRALLSMIWRMKS